MSHSSLFSFEESSIWDPKVIRKFLVVPQDQLTKLNSMPGWAKIQDNQNTTLRLDKDLSIENSQSECSIKATQNNKRIEKNTELFYEQTENRREILKCYKVYGGKITRSLSLITINENYDSLLNSKTLKKALSLQNLSQSSVLSDTNNHFKEFISENSSKRPFKNFTLPNQCNIRLSESEKGGKLVLSKEINIRTMETVSELPVTISTPVENANLHFETEKENNSILFIEKVTAGSKNMSDEYTKNVSESTNAVNMELDSETKESNDVLPSENVNLLSEAIKESNGVLPSGNTALCSNNVSEHAKTVNKYVNVDNESYVPVSSVSCYSDASGVKANLPTVSENLTSSLNVPEVQAKVMPIGENITLSLNVQDNENVTLHVREPGLIISSNLCNKNETNSFIVKEKFPSDCSASVMNTDNDKLNSLENTKPPVSISVECSIPDLSNVEETVPENVALTSVKNNDVNLHQLSPSKSIALDIPVEELSTSNKETVLKTENLGSDMHTNYMINDQKKCDDKTCDPAKSVTNEGSFSKKRKLESRSKRSKRLKSDEKPGNLKIRSIKKVREICYSVEEVKSMLDIMKQLL